jgi:chaperonin GroES
VSANNTSSGTTETGPAEQSGSPPDTELDILDELERRLLVNIRPLQDRVLIKRIDEQEQVRGGIIIPDTAKEKPQEAEVVAVGPGKTNDDGKRVPIDIKVGDKVLVGKYSGSDIKIDGEDYVIVREDEILAVVG